MKSLCLFFILVVGLFAQAQAQEMCFTCTGSHYWRGHRTSPEQTSQGYAVGFCLDKKNMEVTYDTAGSVQTKWRFAERIESAGTVYYYWRKEYDNGLFGRLSEQIELSDVKLHYQYVAKEKKDMSVVIAVNANCTPVQRIGR
jgi:hypothetical protein